ncbi:hypothetical protein AB0C70_39620 [Streptomyces sp. NPDC048564]
MSHLRQLVRDWMDGLRAGVDTLLYGRPYPRTISLRELGRMKRQPPTA